MVSSRDESARHFELRANGKPVMLVDNSAVQLMVMIAGDSQERIPHFARFAIAVVGTDAAGLGAEALIRSVIRCGQA